MNLADLNDVAAAVAVGEQAAEADSRVLNFDIEPSDEEIEDIPAVLLSEGQRFEVPTKLIEAIESRRAAPRRRSGIVSIDDLISFEAYLNKYKRAQSSVFASLRRFVLTAVLDYHDPGPTGAGWGEHRVIYGCPRAPEWELWSRVDGKSLSQTELADLIEERLEDLVGKGGFPPPVEVLEMARNLQVHTKGRFERKIDPTTGAYRLVATEDRESTSTAIPRAFLLGLRVFEGGERYQVEARLRLKMREGVPMFSISLHRRTEIERDAFGDVVAHVQTATDLDVFGGMPEGCPPA
ncbi:MAG TPA: DUF2303 family protein [Kofleriaceae bacterium]|nr:DUF2303 family protein [Kofleriaceae bacterium]